MKYNYSTKYLNFYTINYRTQFIHIKQLIQIFNKNVIPTNI